MNFKKTDLLVLLLITLVLAVIFFISPAQAETYRQTYEHGLKAVGDSTDYPPGYLLVCHNLIPDISPVLKSREGFSAWNQTKVDTFTIDNIFFYRPYPDTTRLVFACNGFVYIADSAAVDTITDWDSYRLSFSDDSLIAFNDSPVVYRPSPTWWYAKVAGNDVIEISGAEYTIKYLSGFCDSSMTLNTNYTGTTKDTANFTVYKRFNARPTFEQYGSRLYISSSQGFSIVYDDTVYQFLCLIDSGTVDDEIAAATEYDVYSDGQIQIFYGSNIVKGGNGADFGATASGIAADGSEILKFNYDVVTNWPLVHRVTREFASPVIDLDSNNNTLTLADAWEVFTDSAEHFPYAEDREYRDYLLTSEVTPCNFDADSVIVDGSKNWFDDVYRTKYLKDLYFVSAEHGYYDYEYIYCNTDSMFFIDGESCDYDGDNYYIFSGLPYSVDTTSVYDDEATPFYSQITFYNNQLYAFGRVFKNSSWDYSGNQWYLVPGLPSDLNHVWNSELYMPAYTKLYWGSSLDYGQKITSMFKMRNGLYVTMPDAIYYLSGIASTDARGSEQTIQKLSDNLGVNDIDNWCHADIELNYFIDKTGLYEFNGVRPTELSMLVQPLIERIFDYEVVIGYLNHNVYISFYDLGYTLVYNDILQSFYSLGLGMNCIYPQESSGKLFFGDNDSPGYICYWPNGAAVDSFPDTTLGFDIMMKTAKQNIFGLYNESMNTTNKIIDYVVCDIKSNLNDSLSFKVYVDHGTLASDTIIYLAHSNNYIWQSPIGEISGERFQFEISSDYCTHKTIIRPMEAIIRWIIPKKLYR